MASAGRFPQRLRIAGMVVVALVAAFGAIGYLAIPAATRWAVETVASRELGRTVRVESISANPFTLRVTLRGLAVDGAAGEAEPLLSVGRIDVDASVESVLRRAPVLDALAIDGLVANLVRVGPQRFNFSDIVERLQARPQTGEQTARFALNNIEVGNSTVTLDDRVGGGRHAATGIRLGIPFVSNLPSHVEINVEPAFAAKLDGTPVEVKGQTRPFHETLESSIDLKLDALDIPKYLAFAPVPLDFRIRRGWLDTELRVVFRRAVPARGDAPAQQARMLIGGAVAVRDFALTAPAGTGAAPLIDWQSLRIVIDELEPLQRRVVLGDIALAAPHATVVRNPDGSINWVRFASQPVQAPIAAPAGKTTGEPGAAPFAVTLGRAAVSGGRVSLLDEAAGGFRLEVTNLRAEATGLSSASPQRGRLSLAADIVDNGSVSLDGEAGLAPPAGRLKYAARDVRLVVAARYLAQVFNGTIDGSSDVDGSLEFEQAADGLRLALRDVAVAGKAIKVRGPASGGAALDIAALSINGADLDLAGRTISIGRLAVDRPRGLVRRLADGTINWLQVVKPPATAGAEGAGSPAPGPWRLLLKEAQVSGGDLRFEDLAVEPAVRMHASAISATARNVVGDGSRPAEIAVRTRFGSGGTLAADGTAGWNPIAAKIKVDARNLDVAALRPYVAGRLNTVVARIEASVRGAATVAQATREQPLKLAFAGDARLSNLHLLDASGDNDLLKWQSLEATAVDLRLGDGPPRVDVGRVALSDFYARVILGEDGRLNLADLLRPEPAEAAAAHADQAAASAAEAPARPAIRLGGVEIQRGNVNFTDNFIRPSYTANLTDLAGTVGGFSSERAELAEVAIRGRVDSDAPVEISGKANPLVTPLALDIRGVTRGVELPRLTPYAVKYAGYPIVRGKLSMDVHYRIDDRRLQADNRLFLDQLTFGERIDSPAATKLPVQLALSLLKNSRGEIDINLPISGSLDDPKFSIGGIIVQVIVNLLTRIVTAPFTALAAAFGGGADLGHVAFAPGSASIADGELQKLETLAKALNDRPGLRLDMTGRALAAADEDALRRAKLDARLRAAKVRELVRTTGDSVDPATVAIAPEERERLIGRVYAEEKIPEKPRNLVGMAKSIPAAEMEALILGAITVTEEDLRRLANDRSTTVRDRLSEQGKVPRERLFLVAPVLDGSGDAKLPPTRVDFSLK
jgi:uncharacterized protein involved in outer membrane biogenesis